jgi:hypothetical protein
VVLYYNIEILKIKASVQGQHKAQAYPALHERETPATEALSGGRSKSIQLK